MSCHVMNEAPALPLPLPLPLQLADSNFTAAQLHNQNRCAQFNSSALPVPVMPHEERGVVQCALALH